MKYRVQLNAVFNNTDANAILNHIEGIKSSIYKAVEPTQVQIVREAKKLEYISDGLVIATEYASVDFDAVATTHVDVPADTELEILLDVSFSVEQDNFDLLNYLETIKGQALTTSNQIRTCRFFICRHEEVPIQKDGEYSYTDFDGTILTYPIVE